MRIMNVTNYSTQKQNRPNFGMKLDFSKKLLDTLGKQIIQDWLKQ